MSISFSDTTTNTGILQQVRKLMRVDTNQWPTANVVASVNNWHDYVTGYAIGADNRFDWDDTNHSKLPIGTTNLVANQSDYSFLTDEQGNSIITLTRIDILDTDGLYRPLTLIHKDDIPLAIDEYKKTAALPQEYIKLGDNIIRLKPKPLVSVPAGLQFHFQRTGSYFVAADTTKSPGVSPLLHRGYVIAAAYDGALTLGLQNLQGLGAERQLEEQKMIKYFASRNEDEQYLSIGGECVNSQ
jgi:hypothetical protein